MVFLEPGGLARGSVECWRDSTECRGTSVSFLVGAGLGGVEI